MIYSTAAHFTGVTGNRVDFTSQIPWVYVIAAFHERLLYVGETYDQAGLIVRLSTHFGRLTESTFKKAASNKLGIISPQPPFFVLAARLPIGESTNIADASSKKVRLLYEEELHRLFSEKFIASSGWTLISSFTSSGSSAPDEIATACESIYENFASAKDFLQPLSIKTPFQLVLLDYKLPTKEEKDIEVGKMLERIEIQLFDWILSLLKQKFPENTDDWWLKGIPVNTRKQCQARKEDEAISGMNPEAYLTLIDFRDIFKSNWDVFGSSVEVISEQQGKDKSTMWLVELNNIRKIWAHPIKQKYNPIQPVEIIKVRNISTKLKEVLPRHD